MKLNSSPKMGAKHLIILLACFFVIVFGISVFNTQMKAQNREIASHNIEKFWALLPNKDLVANVTLDPDNPNFLNVKLAKPWDRLAFKDKELEKERIFQVWQIVSLKERAGNDRIGTGFRTPHGEKFGGIFSGI